MKSLLPGAEESEKSIYENYLAEYFNEQFPDAECVERCKEWTLSNSKFRMFYIIFELLEEKHMTFKLNEEMTVFD